ncbi:MAG: sulfatase-like hydrolase/transferase [Chthoniobacter sp.]|uniref:sulfatase family protein n=1 Tax=Chthoniobacter sp. TaxID=2510640 RepID=UPI0032AD177A
MKPVVTLLAALLLAPLAALHTAEAPPSAARKPNIILIYSDDHGYADLGAQGVDKDIRTPNLDALARDGVRFVRGYVSAPQCVPSRAGVMTGRYQQRFGVEDNTKGPLPLAEQTIAELLKPAGYVSCQVGKWHLEPPPARGAAKEEIANTETGARAFLPGGQGFDEYFTGPMNNFMASHDLQGHKLPNAPQMLTDKRFRCIWQTDAALSFIDRHAHDPFFLYLAYFTPHVPLESPEPWFSRTPEYLPRERRQALAMIAAMDEGIGKIRARLREQGIDQNTLIFFIGDNGAPLHAGAWDGSLNLPLVGEKGMLTDGGIRTPFLAAWPGTLPAGKSYEPPVINLDVAATAVALAGLPRDEKLDGVNLIPFLLGEKTDHPHAALFWRWRSQAAIRSDHWKLILLGPTERFLFDLNGPEGQTELAKNNLLTQFPEVAADLEKQLMAWNATLPPPTLPREQNAQDEMFYDTHVKLTGAKSTTRKKAAASSGETANTQAWLGRNCTLQVADGALHLLPDGKAARPFITRNGLNLAGPVTATLRVRCPGGGTGQISWRTQTDDDFSRDKIATCKLAATADWQDVKVEIPITDLVIHVRVAFPGATDPEIARIELRGANTTISTDWSAKTRPSQP